MSAIRFRQVNVTGGIDPEQVPAAQVNADFFKLFGASTIHGRTFTADEDRPNGGHVVVLSYGFWQRRFGGDPGIVGRSISLDDAVSVVVGILAPSFDTAIFNASPDVWVPLQLDPNSTFQSPSLRAAARLRPGITLDLANAEARLAGAEFGRQFPNVTGPNDTFALAPFQQRHGEQRAAVIARAAGRRRPRVTHRVRERGEPAPRACIRAPARVRDPDHHRREPWPHRSPAAHREPGAVTRRRRIGSGAWECRRSRPVDPESWRSASHRTARRRHHP